VPGCDDKRKQRKLYCTSWKKILLEEIRGCQKKASRKEPVPLMRCPGFGHIAGVLGKKSSSHGGARDNWGQAAPETNPGKTKDGEARQLEIKE